MDSTTRVISILIILVATVAIIIVTQFVRRRRDLFAFREIRAYSALPMLIGEAIEANRPVHISFGSAGIGANNTLLAIATAELAYQVSQRAAIGAAPPIITVSDTSTLPLAYGTLRRAYQARDLLDNYRASSVRWYPAGPRSLAFAAALTATLGDDRVGTNVLAGSFGPEIALVAEAAARRNQSLIATSDQLEGQAVAYAMSDEVLIGEEIFAAGAYLGEGSSQIATLVATDVLRWLVILGILVPVQVEVAAKLGIGNNTALMIIVIELILFVVAFLATSLRGLRRR